jgi:MraZ protein
MFTGCHDHVLDEKGRTSLPKDFRKTLEDGAAATPWITALPSCLAILPDPTFKKIMNGLGDTGLLFERAQRIQRLFVGMAVQCQVDKQGRILIPPKLRSWAHLERDIVFTGLGPHIEIWDRVLHERDLLDTRDHFPEFSEALQRLRGPIS